MDKLITNANLQSVFPDIEIALCIYLIVTNCSLESSFSTLKRIKNELRWTMRQDRLNHLTLMSLAHEVRTCYVRSI
jgi:hAT family C-terminal dimerisation region